MTVRRYQIFRSGLFVSLILLCGAGLWISDFLVRKHSPVRTRVEAQADQASFLGSVCEGESGKDGKPTSNCDDVVKGEFGTISIPWPTEVSEKSLSESEPEAEGGSSPSVPPTANPVSPTTPKVIKWMPQPVPIALLGMCFYIFMLVWFVFTGIPTRAARRWHLLPLMLCIASVVAAVVYSWIMAFVIRQWCPLCLSLHGIDFLLLLVVVGLWPFQKYFDPGEESTSGRGAVEMKPDQGLGFGHVAATLVCALAFCLIPFVHRQGQWMLLGCLTQKQQERIGAGQYESLKNDATFLVSTYLGTRPSQIPRRPTESTSGDSQAEHELILFSDLQCPACKGTLEFINKEVLPLWQGRLKMTFRHYPLAKACNPFSVDKHPQACLAAYAVEAAQMQGGAEAFWKMHDLIFTNQPKLGSANWVESGGLVNLAKQIGLDPERFKNDMNSEEVKQRVSSDVAAARRLGVSSTPTVFLDGRRIFSIQRASKPFWEAITKIYLHQTEAPNKPAIPSPEPEPTPAPGE